MISKAKLIHKTYITYLPTAFPVNYYGMPNGKVYFIFSRFYEIDYGNTGLEFIVAEHCEFSFDYEKETISVVKKGNSKLPVYTELIDKPDPIYRTIKTYRNLNSYGEAQNILNIRASRMIEKLNSSSLTKAS